MHALLFWGMGYEVGWAAAEVAAAAAELVGEVGVVEETESVRLADVVKVNGPMPSANFDSLSKSTLSVPF